MDWPTLDWLPGLSVAFAAGTIALTAWKTHREALARAPEERTVAEWWAWYSRQLNRK